jgi:hypothetical protein
MGAQVPRKRPRGIPNQLAEPLPTVDGTEWGPAMKALSSDRHRAFVLALYQIPPGYGAHVKAAKMAGFGTSTSSAKSWSVIASMLAHSEKILAAILKTRRPRYTGAARAGTNRIATGRGVRRGFRNFNQAAWPFRSENRLSDANRLARVNAYGLVLAGADKPFGCAVSVSGGALASAVSLRGLSFCWMLPCPFPGALARILLQGGGSS